MIRPISTSPPRGCCTCPPTRSGSRSTGTARPGIVGTLAEVAGIVARYQEAGADELIMPDFMLGSLAEKKETCDLFMTEVAPAFR